MTAARPRRLGGALFAAGLYATAYCLVVGLDTGSRFAIVVDDLGNLVSPVIAAVCCLLAARRTQGRSRLSWELFGAYAGVWALGQLAWVWYEVVRDTAVPFPGLPDVGYVLAVPFVVLALLIHPEAPRFAAARLRLGADSLIVGTALLALSWRLTLSESYHSAGAHGLAQVLGLGYPMSDVVVMTLLILVGIRARGLANRPLVLVAVCLGLGVVGHLVYGVQAQNGLWQPGSLVDAAWGVGFLFLALGAHAENGDLRREVRPRTPAVKSALLPYLPLLGVFVVVVVDQGRGHMVDVAGRWMGATLFLAVLGRQLVALLENGRMARGLEATVAERTAELQRSTDELQQQAWTDSLTGLPNRARLFDLIDEALRRGPGVVAVLDLDGFKGVNDSLGHATGDELLAAVARRVVAALPPGAIAARLGGDEFAFVLPGCSEELQARAFGAAVLRSLTGPIDLGARSLVLTGSLGLVLSQAGDSPDSLLRNADVAMYAAKDAGKDRLRVFEPSMREELLARLAMEADLRVALLAGDIVPWFQPVVDLETGLMTGVEALARWPRDGLLVSPAQFVPLAEQSGLVAVLGRQVLRASCFHAAAWNREAPLTLAVNLSAVQLASDDLVDLVREALDDSGLAPDRLVLEITETVLMEDHLAVGPRLAVLRALGIRIALDDFGTGYSALGYLQKIPVDIVKIDRAFVREVHLGARQSALAAAVMTLAGSLDLDVIAEGIELPAQADRLRALGCRLAQGFLYNPALPPAELLASWRRERAAAENGREFVGFD